MDDAGRQERVHGGILATVLRSGHTGDCDCQRWLDLHLPARDIPSKSLSPQAQAIIAMGPVGGSPYPALDDPEAWRRRAAESDASIVQMMGDRASQVSADVEEVELDGVRVYVITPHGLPSDDRRAVLEIHGGGFITGEARVAGSWGSTLSDSVGSAPGPWTTECHPITRTLRRSMTAWPRIGHSSVTIGPTRSSSGADRQEGISLQL